MGQRKQTMVRVVAKARTRAELAGVLPSLIDGLSTFDTRRADKAKKKAACGVNAFKKCPHKPSRESIEELSE